MLRTAREDPREPTKEMPPCVTRPGLRPPKDDQDRVLDERPLGARGHAVVDIQSAMAECSRTQLVQLSLPMNSFDGMQPGSFDLAGRTCPAPLHWTITTGPVDLADAGAAATAIPAAVPATTKPDATNAETRARLIPELPSQMR